MFLKPTILRDFSDGFAYLFPYGYFEHTYEL